MSIRFIDKIFGKLVGYYIWYAVAMATEFYNAAYDVSSLFLQLEMAVVEREEKGKAHLKLFQTHFMQEQ